MAPSPQAINFLRSTLRRHARLVPSDCTASSVPRLQSSRHWGILGTRPYSFIDSCHSTRLAPKWNMSLNQSTQYRTYKTVQEAKSRQRMGPLTPIAVLLFLGSGVGMYYYFVYEKERMERVRIAEHSKGIGKPKVGGAFELIDHNGQVFSSEKMKGKYSLVYFGFSHCPDICPEELDKMSEMLSLVEDAIPSSQPRNPDLLPIFITCDPARDTPAVLKAYLKEFDDRMVGLTGAWQQVKDVCKLYRVYFSTPSNVKPGMDYLVDHSIYFYLMDPDGDFVEAIGRQHTAEAAAELIIGHMQDWKGPITKSR